MGDLIVKPSYVFGPNDILDAAKLNLMATPVVELALEDPINDQNYFRNGNFYSSFWNNPAGVSCPAGVWTTNADYWLARPQGAAVNFLQSSTVPDQYSLFSGQIQGAAGVGVFEFGQQVNADISATLRRPCTFSGYEYNATNLSISPSLNIYTCNAFNNFSSVTLQTTVNLQTNPNAAWTYFTATLDLSTLANTQNGLLIAIQLPAGAINDPSKSVYFSRLKFQTGSIATAFVDDASLFITSPTVDSTMLQDGCIARPSLFLPDVIPTGAYQDKSIENGDIDDGAIDARTLSSTAVTGSLGYTPVNKGGDVGVGIVDFATDTVVGGGAPQLSAVIVEQTAATASNDGYFASIGFLRGTVQQRAVGLDINGKLKTVDQNGVVGWLLDSVHQVDTNSIQDGAVTYAKLDAALVGVLVSPGTVQMFASPAPPTGWLICDGSAISRTTYAALFSAIGTYWGAGNNTTTFNIPDMRGRTPIGYVNAPVGGITARTFGSTGGEELHQLVVSELASHDHPITDPGHSHTYTFTGWQSGNQVSGNTLSLQNPPATTSTNQTGITVNKNGSDQGHNNMQPFAVLYFIIKF